MWSRIEWADKLKLYIRGESREDIATIAYDKSAFYTPALMADVCREISSDAAEAGALRMSALRQALGAKGLTTELMAVQDGPTQLRIDQEREQFVHDLKNPGRSDAYTDGENVYVRDAGNKRVLMYSTPAFIWSPADSDPTPFRRTSGSA